ncbi:MAG: sensor histidine kinase [Caldilineaceae bacterium]
MEERQQLARELHDSVTQSLYSVNLLAETAHRAVTANDLERTNYLVDRVGEMARQALKEMRLLVYELRPAALAQEGLVGALQQRLDTVEGRAGVKTQLRIDGDPARIPQQMEAHLYRIAQEALNNALKHAEAVAVTVLLSVDTEFVTLTIKDNGRGFRSQPCARTWRHRTQEHARTLPTVARRAACRNAARQRRDGVRLSAVECRWTAELTAYTRHHHPR